MFYIKNTELPIIEKKQSMNYTSLLHTYIVHSFISISLIIYCDRLLIIEKFYYSVVCSSYLLYYIIRHKRTHTREKHLNTEMHRSWT